MQLYKNTNFSCYIYYSFWEKERSHGRILHLSPCCRAEDSITPVYRHDTSYLSSSGIMLQRSTRWRIFLFCAVPSHVCIAKTGPFVITGI